jgi:hypothetical protein
MFESIKQWFAKYRNDIILVIGVILISSLAFALGYITAKQEDKEPIKIEKTPLDAGYNPVHGRVSFRL